MAKSRWAELQLVAGDVLRSLANQLWIILKKPDSTVAVAAKQAANPAGGVAVVNSERTRGTAGGFVVADIRANSAHAALRFQHCIVLFWLHTKTLLSAYVGQLTIQSFAVALAVSCLRFASAVLAKPLQLINLSGCKVKLRYRFNGIAGAAPLHTRINSRAARSSAVVPTKVCKRLPFDPPQLFPIARRNVRWPSTTTLANTLWNNLVSHFIFLNRNKAGI